MSAIARLVKLSRVGLAAGAFLGFSAPVSRVGSTRALSSVALPATSRLSTFIPRGGVPQAFEGAGKDEIDSLSDEQIQSLLAKLQSAAGLTPSEVDRVDVVEHASPSVAFIQCSITQPSNMLMGQREYPLGAGSGFVWDEHGHIITNYHVVAGSGRGQDLPRRVMVKLQGVEDQLEAKVVGYEADKDLAVLKVDTENVRLKPLQIGSSSSLKVGQNVLAIGNPFGLDFTLTMGIVSALGRDIQGFGGRPIKDCLQTDAAINPGNSGGPLLDSRGRLIGVNTMIYAPNGVGANVGIGFAIPVDTVRRVVNQIIEFGQNARPSLGVTVLPDSDRERFAVSLGRKLEGAIVNQVLKGSPADALNLEPTRSQRNGILLGDMIVAINGEPVKKNEDLLCAVEETEPSQPMTVTVMRSCNPDQIEELETTPVQRKALRLGQ